MKKTIRIKNEATNLHGYLNQIINDLDNLKEKIKSLYNSDINNLIEPVEISNIEDVTNNVTNNVTKQVTNEVHTM